MEKLILIIDDDNSIREILRLMLRAYRVIEACDGSEGLQMARQYQPDLIISDSLMPEMGGSELFCRLKSNPLTSSIPFILASADPEQRRKALFNGSCPEFFLEKPFKPRNLLLTVENAFKLALAC